MLILVVALLVLLALMGTAFINTSGTDRYSSAQNEFNTEVDLLVQGLESITQGVIVDGLFNNSNFHQTADPAPPSYAMSDYPLNVKSTFIGDRFPTLPMPQSPPGTSNEPLWHLISQLPSFPNFESPYQGAGNTLLIPGVVPDVPPTYPDRSAMYPVYLSIPSGTGTQQYPALYDTTKNMMFLAADTDGDGIADAGLFRLPVGTIKGVTYFGAVRVLDNASAVNAATAWKPNSIGAGLPGNFFPSNLDLFDLLVTGDTVDNLNQDTASGNKKLGRFGVGQTSATSSMPVDDSGAARLDYSFNSDGVNSYEAFWMQLGRRLGNPGFNTSGVKYQALSLTESQRMARKFVLRDPAVATAASSSSALEQLLPKSVFQSPTAGLGPVATAYSPSNALQWYQQNFDFANGGMPLRAALVAQNPVSNFTYSKLNSRGAYVAGTYKFGDWVVNAADNRAYVCLQTTTAAPDPASPSNGVWERQTWLSSPTKAAANTATFGQLWPAYFSAMSETPAPGSVLPKAQNAMFRNAIRTVTSPNWTSVQQMQLRAAIAAQNTIQLRGLPDALTSHNIQIADSSGTGLFNVTLYGSSQQPYITEVFASTAGGVANSYVAIELYNPYSYDMTLTNWQLQAIARPNGGSAPLVTTPIMTWTATPPVVPAHGFAVIASAPLPPPTVTVPPTGTVYVVPNLASAGLGNELVLLRPIGTDTIPVDSYDFTGLDTSDPAPGHEWYYVRPNQSQWHCVYPGPYSAVNAAGPDFPRQTGTVSTPPSRTTLASMGMPDTALAVAPTGSSSYIDRPLQVNNVDFGGPNKLKSSGNLFPYGGFARNVDLLQVTYVGAYRIFDSTGNLVEVNPITMDSAFADDPTLNVISAVPTAPNTVISEQQGRQSIGRFCPVHWADSQTTPATTSESVIQFDDYWQTDATHQTAYYWTQRFFDYLTVQAPQDDYLPDADPANYAAVASPSVANGVANTDPNIVNAQVTTSPTPPQIKTEEGVGVQGRININTANWRVLATLPMFDSLVPGNLSWQANVQLAQSIVYYRDVDDGTGASPAHGHGPFQSIYELNNVPIAPATVAPGPIPTNFPGTAPTAPVLFRNVFGLHGTDPATPGPTAVFVVSGPHASNNDGDLTPYVVPATTTTLSTAGQDGVLGDFENQNLAVNRISNLITTRSDSFIAYVIVQGWQNVGTNRPQLVVQRRAAFIIDRSGVTPANKTASVTNVPVN